MIVGRQFGMSTVGIHLPCGFRFEHRAAHVGSTNGITEFRQRAAHHVERECFAREVGIRTEVT